MTAQIDHLVRRVPVTRLPNSSIRAALTKRQQVRKAKAVLVRFAENGQGRLLGFPRRQHRPGSGLFQRDLAHGLITHDLANFQTLDSQLALLVFSADRFGGDGICLVAEAIQCGHVRIFHHK